MSTVNTSSDGGFGCSVCECTNGYTPYDPPQVSCGPGIYSPYCRCLIVQGCGNGIIDTGESWFKKPVKYINFG